MLTVNILDKLNFIIAPGHDICRMMHIIVERRKYLFAKYPELAKLFKESGYEFIHEKCEPDRSFKVIATLLGQEVGFCDVLVSGQYADITFVYVKPQFRCLGIGTRLVAKAIEECKNRGIKVITADVLDWTPIGEVNPEAAKKILMKLGFKQEQPQLYILRLGQE